MLLNQWGPLNTWAAVNPVRATLFLNGVFAQIQDAQIGTGLKPVVLDAGFPKVRAASEGVPLVFDSGYLRTIAAGETLLI